MPDFSNLSAIARKLPSSKLKKYNNVVDRQTWVRIMVAVHAYAYEVMEDSLISDHEFDKLCLQVRLSIDTRDRIMDKWFRENFSPDTRMWVWNHPNKAGLHKYYLLGAQRRDAAIHKPNRRRNT